MPTPPDARKKSLSDPAKGCEDSSELPERLRLPLGLLDLVVRELTLQLPANPYADTRTDDGRQEELGRLASDLQSLAHRVESLGRHVVGGSACSGLHVAQEQLEVQDEPHQEPATTPVVVPISPLGSPKTKGTESKSFSDDETKEVLIQVFRELDGDGNGKLSSDELRRALETMGLCQSRAQKLIRSADVNGDNAIDLVEWTKVIESGHSKELKQIGNDLMILRARNGSIYRANDEEQEVKCMLRPDAAWRLTWDFVLATLCGYIAISLPFTTGFAYFIDAETTATIATSEAAIDMLFILDLVLNFRTGYFTPEGTVVMNPYKVARNYCRTWFILDFVSSVPVDLLSGGQVGSVRALKLLKIPKFARVFRVLGKILTRESALMDVTEEVFASSNVRMLARRSSIVGGMLLICHWMACFMALSGAMWLESYQNVKSSLSRVYLAALYWAMTTMTTVGYGDITPTTDGERIFSVIAMVIGGSFYGYAIGTISSMVANRDLNARAYHDRMDLVYAWIDHVKFPRSLRRRVLRYFKAHLTEKSAVNEAELVAELSPDLQKEVCSLLIPEEILHNPAFDGLPMNAFALLSTIVQKISAEADQVVTYVGEVGTAMFIVRSGTLKLSTADDGETAPLLLHTGDSFGEEILVQLKESYAYDVVALEPSRLFCIYEREFCELFLHMPDVRETVKKNVMESLS